MAVKKEDMLSIQLIDGRAIACTWLRMWMTIIIGTMRIPQWNRKRIKPTFHTPSIPHISGRTITTIKPDNIYTSPAYWICYNNLVSYNCMYVFSIVWLYSCTWHIVLNFIFVWQTEVPKAMKPRDLLHFNSSVYSKLLIMVKAKWMMLS